jgi:hypothetical protein
MSLLKKSFNRYAIGVRANERQSLFHVAPTPLA